MEARGRGDPAGEHGGQRRLVDLQHERCSGHPPTHVGQVLPDPGGERLREVTTGADVGQHLVAARLLDRRRERPRPGDLHLERALVALRQLLRDVEVLSQQRAGAALVDAGRVGEPPPGRLQVEAELAHQRHRPAGHPGDRPARRQLGQVREVGQLAEHDPHRLHEVLPRHRAEAGGACAHADAVRRVEAIVADPTTRVPS